MALIAALLLSSCAARSTPHVITGPGYMYVLMEDGRYAIYGDVPAAMKAIGCGICNKQEVKITIVKPLK